MDVLWEPGPEQRPPAVVPGRAGEPGKAVTGPGCSVTREGARGPEGCHRHSWAPLSPKGPKVTGTLLRAPVSRFPDSGWSRPSEALWPHARSLRGPWTLGRPPGQHLSWGNSHPGTAPPPIPAPSGQPQVCRLPARPDG